MTSYNHAMKTNLHDVDSGNHYLTARLIGQVTGIIRTASHTQVLLSMLIKTDTGKQAMVTHNSCLVSGKQGIVKSEK